MAAPPNKTIKDLSGTWAMNSQLSDSLDAGLTLQGINFLVRKAIGLAQITVSVNQYEAPPKAPSTAEGTYTAIDIDQSASGLSSTQENRCLDDVGREHSDWLFGTVMSRSSWTSLDKVDDEFLRKGWDVDQADTGKTPLVLTSAENKDYGWTATQVWGFQTIDGERHYCRNVVFTKGQQRAEARLVYDWVPPE
ncbi:hypothetical protein CDD81_2240 [Ophiocordyceps australis]|uniref:Lipocalin-like domain-containing protein n=1 Tax=Ophiocordyceps australis TaxID=1399860 RepID=A0A2C5YDA7_9HYPO|nr:hypothetical protein CDD81_2240 [Ophiocordyceps australis]